MFDESPGRCGAGRGRLGAGATAGLERRVQADREPLRSTQEGIPRGKFAVPLERDLERKRVLLLLPPDRFGTERGRQGAGATAVLERRGADWEPLWSTWESIPRGKFVVRLEEERKRVLLRILHLSDWTLDRSSHGEKMVVLSKS